MRVVIHNFMSPSTPLRPFVVRDHKSKAERERKKRTPPAASTLTHDCADEHEEPCGCGYYNTVDSAPAEYFMRVDAWLNGLPDVAAKKKFLQKQRVDFERRYTDFRKRAGRNGTVGPNETAEAYIETLTGLTSRLDRLG